MAYNKIMKSSKVRAKSKDKPSGIAEKVICMLDIINRIEQGLNPSPAGLAAEYGLTRRSIHRYLEIINFIVPIEYDMEAKGYRFSANSPLQKVSLSEQERLLLLILGDAVSHMGSGFQEHYRGLLGKLLSASVSSDAGIGDLPIAVGTMKADDSPNVTKNFPVIADAVIKKNPLDIKYHAVYSQEITERRIDPYGIVFSDGNWLMIGFCHEDQDIRKFDMDRILAIRQLWTKFNKEDFDLQQYIDERWGLYDGEKTTVKVRFSKQVAHLITRKKKWHPSERRDLLLGGEVELTFDVMGTEKLKKWLYAWIPNVVIIEPKRLREEMQRDLKQNLAQLTKLTKRA